MFVKYFVPCLYAFFACLAFCVVFVVKDKKIILVSCFGGALGWFAYLMAEPFMSVVAQNLVASIVIGLFAEIMSRVMKTPATIFLIIGILPLVPGGGIYYTMEYAVYGNTPLFLEKGLQTFAIAAAIAFGVSIPSSIFRVHVYNRKRNVSIYEKYRGD